MALNDGIAFWNALKAKITPLIRQETSNCFRMERYDVTTAPDGATIGVTLPEGNNEIFIPYSAEVATALVGDTVIVGWRGALSNAKAIWFGNGYNGVVSGGGGGSALDAYPIGSIYMSVNSTSPSQIFGGTWERIQNTFLLAAGTQYTAGSTGGEASHTLTTSEMPSHSHSVSQQYLHRLDSSDNNYVNYGDGGSLAGWDTYIDPVQNNKGNTRMGIPAFNTNSSGSGNAHNNMPPYLAVYIWKRTA